MKELYKYIVEASLLDTEQQLAAGDEYAAKAEIMEFIKKNYEFAKYAKIKGKTADGKYIVDAKDVRAKNEIETLTNGMFVWGTIAENFDCMFTDDLKSIDGCPSIVKGSLDLRSNHITSIKGLTTKVSGSLSICFDNLVNAAGADIQAKRLYIDSKVIKDLKGIEKYNVDSIGLSFCDSLISLEGSPRELKGAFKLEECPKIASLKGAPELAKEVDITYCEAIEDFTDMPHVTDNIVITGKAAHKRREELKAFFIENGKVLKPKQVFIHRS